MDPRIPPLHSFPEDSDLAWPSTFHRSLGGEQKETKRLFWRYGQAGVGRDGTLLEGSKSESILKAK